MDGVKLLGTWIVFLCAVRENFGMENYRRTASQPREIAERLIRFRTALGKDQAEFARDAGLQPTAYNNYERGNRIGLDAAIALCIKFNLTLDWIYFEDTAGLPASVLETIDAVHKAPVAKTRLKRRPFRAASSRSLVG